MKKAFLRDHGKSGIELAEEAFVLLRTSPPALVAAYYLGSVPFAAGFLVFCSDLGGRTGAETRLGGATLAMTALFFWMKFFQARFAAGLLARLRGQPPVSAAPGPVLRSLSIQMIAHAAGLFLLPLAAIALVPFAWVQAFFQNLSVLDDGRSRLRDLARAAWRQATLWPAQNHTLLALLFLFAFYVFVNWITIGLFGPQLLKMFFGLESVFTQSPMSLLNTTFFAAAAALTYLSVDPLIKTCAVLRCFYGESLKSGEDLKAKVRRLRSRSGAVATAVFLALASPILAAEQPNPPPPVTTTELDRSISTVIQQDKYLWRSPPEKDATDKEGLFAGFFQNLSRMVQEMAEFVGELFRKLLEWIFPQNRSPASSFDLTWLSSQNVLLFGLLALVAAGLALAALRVIQRRRRAAAIESTSITTVPDLEDERTAADELPEDDWTRLGRQFLEQGDCRLALRAFYLAGLSHLAARRLVTIARFKSNRDYERELARRGHTQPELPVLFGENIGVFERSWYGRHEANPEVIRLFVANLEKMRSLA